MSKVRTKGRLVSDRLSANEAIVAAFKVLDLAQLLAHNGLSADTTGNANRLNDYVREVIGKLRNAEKLLEQRGSE